MPPGSICAVPSGQPAPYGNIACVAPWSWKVNALRATATADRKFEYGYRPAILMPEER
jgi:hypothetical protein